MTPKRVKLDIRFTPYPLVNPYAEVNTHFMADLTQNRWNRSIMGPSHREWVEPSSPP